MTAGNTPMMAMIDATLSFSDKLLSGLDRAEQPGISPRHDFTAAR